MLRPSLGREMFFTEAYRAAEDYRVFSKPIEDFYEDYNGDHVWCSIYLEEIVSRRYVYIAMPLLMLFVLGLVPCNEQLHLLRSSSCIFNVSSTS